MSAGGDPIMNIINGNQAARLLKNLVYEKKQVHSASVDLTVKSIARILSAGILDFGGSEFKPGESLVIDAQKSDPAEKYGWWFLDKGEYLLEYNEELSLPDRHIAIIQPHERIIEAGITHGVRFLTEPDEKLMSIIRVAQAGVRIKENARVSNLIVLKPA